VKKKKDYSTASILWTAYQVIQTFFKIYLKKKNILQKHLPLNHGWRRLSQRVAMDDLASYFVEERSKVR